MKPRITKTKLLKKLTKKVDEAHSIMDHCTAMKWLQAAYVWRERYNTLIEIRRLINDHRI